MAGRTTTIKDDRFKSGNKLPKFSTTTTTTKPTTTIGGDIGKGIGALLPKNLKKRKTQGLDFE